MNTLLLHLIVFASVAAAMLALNLFLALMVFLRRFGRDRSERASRTSRIVTSAHGRSAHTLPTVDFSTFYEIN
ncbi:MAG TPA: hypothetical protein DCE39_02175 [Planctomycetaceae bacterium]|mgnify:FL=1|nr:hypothetical protein [Planctomycetaceae bacterium]